MEFVEPDGLVSVFGTPVFDMEALIGVAGWGGTAVILEMLDETNIETKDFWVVQKAAEIGFETGLRTTVISE